MAHDGRALLLPTHHGVREEDEDDNAVGCTLRYRQAAKPVWWRTCGQHDRTEESAQIWAGDVTSELVCEWCKDTFPSARARRSHQARAPCTTEAPKPRGAEALPA